MVVDVVEDVVVVVVVVVVDVDGTVVEVVDDVVVVVVVVDEEDAVVEVVVEVVVVEFGGDSASCPPLLSEGLVCSLFPSVADLNPSPKHPVSPRLKTETNTNLLKFCCINSPRNNPS